MRGRPKKRNWIIEDESRKKDVGEEIENDDDPEDIEELEREIRRNKRLAETLPPIPATRADCPPERFFGGCLHMRCKYHLAFDPKMRSGENPGLNVSLRILNPIHWRSSMCVLDFVEVHDGGATLDEVGEVMGVTRERIRQIEAMALAKINRFGGIFGALLKPEITEQEEMYAHARNLRPKTEPQLPFRPSPPVPAAAQSDGANSGGPTIHTPSPKPRQPRQPRPPKAPKPPPLPPPTPAEERIQQLKTKDQDDMVSINLWRQCSKTAARNATLIITAKNISIEDIADPITAAMDYKRGDFIVKNVKAILSGSDCSPTHLWVYIAQALNVEPAVLCDNEQWLDALPREFETARRKGVLRGVNIPASIPPIVAPPKPPPTKQPEPTIRAKDMPPKPQKPPEPPKYQPPVEVIPPPTVKVVDKPPTKTPAPAAPLSPTPLHAQPEISLIMVGGRTPHPPPPMLGFVPPPESPPPGARAQQNAEAAQRVITKDNPLPPTLQPQSLMAVQLDAIRAILDNPQMIAQTKAELEAARVTITKLRAQNDGLREIVNNMLKPAVENREALQKLMDEKI